MSLYAFCYFHWVTLPSTIYTLELHRYNYVLNLLSFDAIEYRKSLSSWGCSPRPVTSTLLPPSKNPGYAPGVNALIVQSQVTSVVALYVNRLCNNQLINQFCWGWLIIRLCSQQLINCLHHLTTKLLYF